MIIGLLVIFLVLCLFSIRQIDEYERGILFRFGKFAKILNPGWHLVFPIVHSYKKVDKNLSLHFKALRLIILFS